MRSIALVSGGPAIAQCAREIPRIERALTSRSNVAVNQIHNSVTVKNIQRDRFRSDRIRLLHNRFPFRSGASFNSGTILTAAPRGPVAIATLLLSANPSRWPTAFLRASPMRDMFVRKPRPARTTRDHRKTVPADSLTRETCKVVAARATGLRESAVEISRAPLVQKQRRRAIPPRGGDAPLPLQQP